jgi:endonuclease-3
MGIVNTKTPEETEYALMAITYEDRWSDINRYLVRHGQVVCLPTHPHCERCKIVDYCKFGKKAMKAQPKK